MAGKTYSGTYTNTILLTNTPDAASVLRCAPLGLSGPAVARARRGVLARQPRARTSVPALSAWAGTVRLAPARRRHERWQFLVPRGAAELVLQTTGPCMLGAALLDGAALDLDRACRAGFGTPCDVGHDRLRPIGPGATLDLPRAPFQPVRSSATVAPPRMLELVLFHAETRAA